MLHAGINCKLGQERNLPEVNLGVFMSDLNKKCYVLAVKVTSWWWVRGKQEFTCNCWCLVGPANFMGKFPQSLLAFKTTELDGRKHGSTLLVWLRRHPNFWAVMLHAFPPCSNKFLQCPCLYEHEFQQKSQQPLNPSAGHKSKQLCYESLGDQHSEWATVFPWEMEHILT